MIVTAATVYETRYTITLSAAEATALCLAETFFGQLPDRENGDWPVAERALRALAGALVGAGCEEECPF